MILAAAAALSSGAALPEKARASSFDLTALRRTRRADEADARRYMPSDPGDITDGDDGFRWKFKGNRVKLWVPLGPS